MRSIAEIVTLPPRPLDVVIPSTTERAVWALAKARNAMKQARGRRSQRYSRLSELQVQALGIMGEVMLADFLPGEPDLGYYEGLDTQRPDFKWRGWALGVKLRGAVPYPEKHAYLDRDELNDDIVVFGAWDFGPVLQWWGWLWTDEFLQLASAPEGRRGRSHVLAEHLSDMRDLHAIPSKNDNLHEEEEAA